MAPASNPVLREDGSVAETSQQEQRVEGTAPGPPSVEAARSSGPSLQARHTSPLHGKPLSTQPPKTLSSAPRCQGSLSGPSLCPAYLLLPKAEPATQPSPMPHPAFLLKGLCPVVQRACPLPLRPPSSAPGAATPLSLGPRGGMKDPKRGSF